MLNNVRDLRSKIALGTVQFGLDYGISNTRGRIPDNEIFDILNFAHKKSITILDTSNQYGDSEIVIGKYLAGKKSDFDIVSKFTLKENGELVAIVDAALDRLKITSLYGYLYHDFKSFLDNPHSWEKLRNIREHGKIKKIGFSLYHTSELEILLKREIDFDIIQIPYNVFDQRFNEYFAELKKNNVEIHSRSVFLQGLVFTKADSLHEYFKKIKPKIELLESISRNSKLRISALCINFALLNEYIDKVVIGVDSKGNLIENIDDINFFEEVKKVYRKLQGLEFHDESIILPYNWKLK